MEPYRYSPPTPTLSLFLVLIKVLTLAVRHYALSDNRAVCERQTGLRARGPNRVVLSVML